MMVPIQGFRGNWRGAGSSGVGQGHGGAFEGGLTPQPLGRPRLSRRRSGRICPEWRAQRRSQPCCTTVSNDAVELHLLTAWGNSSVPGEVLVGGHCEWLDMFLKGMPCTKMLLNSRLEGTKQEQTAEEIRGLKYLGVSTPNCFSSFLCQHSSAASYQAVNDAPCRSRR